MHYGVCICLHSYLSRDDLPCVHVRKVNWFKIASDVSLQNLASQHGSTCNEAHLPNLVVLSALACHVWTSVAFMLRIFVVPVQG
jgi:hypothetical protein